MFKYRECLSYSKVDNDDVSGTKLNRIMYNQEIKHVTYDDGNSIEDKLDDSFAELMPIEYSFVHCNSESEEHVSEV